MALCMAKKDVWQKPRSEANGYWLSHSSRAGIALAIIFFATVVKPEENMYHKTKEFLCSDQP